jgi:hypothetical protein
VRALRAPLALLALALALGAGRADGAPPSPLAKLVVPRSALGSAAAGLQVDLASGEISNARAAGDSWDPSDTDASLTKAGRLTGFRLLYGDPGLQALRRGRGLTDIGTSLDYFKTARQAQAYEAKSLRDLRRVRGQNVGGTIVERVSTFPVRGLGPAAVGVRVAQRIGRARLHNTYVEFQVGTLLGEATIWRADATKVDAQAIAIAKVLADRIVRYAAGKLQATAVTLPRPLGMSRPGPKAPNLESMVLKVGDLEQAAFVVAEGYLPDDNAIGSYFRQFRFQAGSGLQLLRSAVALERSRQEAAGRMLMLRATFTGPEAAATLAGIVFTSATSPRLDGVRSSLGVGDESFSVATTFSLGSRHVRVVLVQVRRQRVVGTLIVVGSPRTVTDGRVGGYARTLDKGIQRAFQKPQLVA